MTKKKIAKRQQGVLREHEKFIISQALMEINSVKDIPRVIEKVEGTAVKIDPLAWKTFKELVASKKKMLESR